MFWFHAVPHFAYLINRMPCRSLKMSSPYIELFGFAPDLSFLKIFGTACYPFLRPYSHDKLEPRSSCCVFLGYALGYKGVFCYNVEKNKLWMSRHVVHDETIFPYHITPASKSTASSSSSRPCQSSASYQYSVPSSFVSPAPSSPIQSPMLPILQVVLPFDSPS
ncbi:putative RNA-directed DNA polymerase [Rosa chinensis]|uniref:Putative RNA-directed DNA polymerase n=1 Tax=Rosa chinensis TaxID=74649 RepID=A0A2P6SEK0_ROSCH|nr:putative RNA-directed DNA polymerase [Rosa chinensis]